MHALRLFTDQFPLSELDKAGADCGISCHAEALKQENPQDVLAAGIVEEATREGESGRNPHAVALGRLGGKKGGPARAKNLTPEQRREIARVALVRSIERAVRILTCPIGATFVTTTAPNIYDFCPPSFGDSDIWVVKVPLP